MQGGHDSSFSFRIEAVSRNNMCHIASHTYDKAI